MTITCPYCDRPAALVTGADVYPHRPDLYHKKFWKCAPCDAWVGCHSNDKRKNGLKDDMPMGRLANAKLRKSKLRAHDAFDPLWKSGEMTRHEAYAWLSSAINRSPANTHIGMLDVEGCEAVVMACRARKA